MLSGFPERVRRSFSDRLFYWQNEGENRHQPPPTVVIHATVYTSIITHSMKIDIELTEHQLLLIETLFSRLLFDHYLDCTDGNHDTDQAYEIQYAVSMLRKQMPDV